MKKLAILLVCLIIIGIGINFIYREIEKEKGRAHEFSKWKEFIPQSKMFKVRLPNLPQYGNDLKEIPGSEHKRHYAIYAAEKINGTLFLIDVITYPPEVDVSSSEDLLNNNLRDFMQGKTNNELKKTLHGVFDTYRSIDFSFNNDEYEIEGKSIHNGQVVYILSYVTKKDEMDESEYKYFIDSFHIQHSGGSEK